MMLAILLLILLAVYLYLIHPDKRVPDTSMLEGWLYAHRGLHDGNVNVPENSLAGFGLAVEKGYGMELDVQLTKDGQLVVHHDGNTRRVCGVDAVIRQTNFADLPLLPDGSHIPLLTEVLANIMGPDVTLISAGEESAFELKRLLKARGLRADEDRRGTSEFYVSDRAEDFERIASVFLQEDLRHAARRIDIDQY